jgi:NitT/TauT family transport system substrate-binding protein
MPSCRPLFVALSLLLALARPSLAQPDPARPALAPPETSRLTITITSASNFIAGFVAIDQGMFAAHGLDVTMTPLAEGSAVIASVVSGSAQLGGPTTALYLQAVDSGLDLVAVAAQYTYPTPNKVGVLAGADSGIKGAADLVGKRVGVPGLNALQHVLLRQWLVESHVPTAKVTYVELSFPQMADALRSHQVDAVTATEPFYQRIVAAGLGNPIFDLGSIVTPGSVGGVYVARRDWAAANPRTIAALRAAMQEAIALIAQKPQVARDSIGHFLKLSPEVVALLSVPALSVSLQPSQLAFWITLGKEQGMLTGTPDATKLIVP